MTDRASVDVTSIGGAPFRADLVTVFHNEVNHAQAENLRTSVAAIENTGHFKFITVDNRQTNRGFARACNLGAFHPDATAPVIGFLNPDVQVHGPFLATAAAILRGRVVITGCRFNKSTFELQAWGVRDWVCGAAMFVTRDWFTKVGGFDERFTWSHEETDLIRQAETTGFQCRSHPLPISHQSPTVDSSVDAVYKRQHFAKAKRRYQQKWKS